jgi:hypothetical protein
MITARHPSLPTGQSEINVSHDLDYTLQAAYEVVGRSFSRDELGQRLSSLGNQDRPTGCMNLLHYSQAMSLEFSGCDLFHG